MKVLLLFGVFLATLFVGVPSTPAQAAQQEWRWNVDDGKVYGDSDRVVAVNVRVESALALSPTAAAAEIEATLGDDRSWISSEDVAFQVVSTETPELTVTIASAATTDRLCLPLNTVGRLSCRRGNQVILNVDRWLNGPDVYHASYDGELDEYRRYLINHEVGHFLGKGHVGSERCSSAVRAPVMMQQTFGLDGCAINGWPALDLTAAGPSKEQVQELLSDSGVWDQELRQVLESMRVAFDKVLRDLGVS